MSETTTVKPTSRKLTIELGISAGLAHIEAVLEKGKIALPGFVYAMALVKREVAIQQAQNSRLIYREVASAGHDLNAIGDITTTFEGGEPVIRFSPDADEAMIPGL